MRLLAFDIEASNLSADFGIILCVGFKEIGGGKTEVYSIADYPGKTLIQQEKNLLKDVREKLLSADVWIAHFGKYFDTVFVNSRLLYHKLSTLPTNFPLIDTWRTAKNALKLRNNRLITLQEFLKLKNEKNAILPEQWILALSGHKPSIAYIVDHCRRDVDVLAEVYERLRPLIIDHPFKDVGKNGACPVCGEKTLQRRGYHLTKTRKFQRYQCQNCGAWTKASQPLTKLQVV